MPLYAASTNNTNLVQFNYVNEFYKVSLLIKLSDIDPRCRRCAFFLTNSHYALSFSYGVQLQCLS